MLVGTLLLDEAYKMHDSMMGQMGMDNEHHNNGQDHGFGNEGWVEINNFSGSQHQSPIHEYGGYSFMQPVPHSLPAEPTFTRMAPPPTQSHQHQLLPLIMPSHPTWPSMLTNPSGFQAPPPVPIPPVSAPLKATKLPAMHQPTPRKTLTDADRRRMCQYHEENPSVKQTEIGAMFGVERSTVSKVLRQKEKYLFPEDRSLSPVKRAKGKFPDIDRALANWVRNSQKQGLPLTDAAIKEKARFFAATVGNPESHIKANSTSWLEKFKQKNGIGAGGKLLRRASETNISDSGSLNPDSAGPSASHSPSGISPTSQGDLTSPSSLSGSKSEENMKGDGLDFDFGNGAGYRHSNSQSTTSLSSAFTDPQGSTFSGGPGSPTTPFAFSPDTFLPSQQSRPPPPNGSSNGGFQRPRSQTFPMLGIDPSYISPPGTSEALTPKYNMTGTAPSSALDSPDHEMSQHSFGGLDSAISSPPTLHHRSSTSSMPPSSTTETSTSGLVSPPTQGSSPSSPTQDDARRALDTLLSYFNNSAPHGLVDHNEYLTLAKLTEKLKLQQSNTPQLPGGLHRIPEQEDIHHHQQQHDLSGKLEHSLTA